MRKNLFFLAAIGLSSLVFITGSCKKNKGVYILEGVITNNTLGEVMTNLSMTVSIQNAGSSSYLNHSTITTDENGMYHVEIERSEMNKIKIEAVKENYFPIKFVLPITNLELDKTYTLNQSTTAKAWARMIFIHQTGDPNLTLQYTKQDGKQDCDECCPKTTQSLTGFVNDTIYCINDGNTNYSIGYEILGQGGFNIESCYTPAEDTGEIVLNY